LTLDTKKLALASLLGGIAAILEITPGIPFDIPFPLYNRVSWDLTGLPIMISLLSTGLLGGIYTAIIGCSIIFFRGNIYGGIFKIIAELATIIAFGMIKSNFVFKSFGGTLSRVIVMTGINYILLPVFYGLPESFVIYILPALAILNASQALINIIPAKIVVSKIRSVQLFRVFS
jgi:hypothetical protein